MFEVEYFIRPNDTMVCPTGISYSDSFFDEFVEKQDILDGFIIFADLYHIVDDCTSDLVGLPGGDDTEFWQANKVFLAYLNSIYFYREFAKNTNLPLSEVIDTYYAREEGMDAFVEGYEALRQKHFPANWSYKQDRHSASVFLAVNNPGLHYIYRSSNASAMAKYVDFGFSIGSGGSFSLVNYYRLCEELVAALKEHPSLLEKHFSRITEDLYYDESLHILAFDLMYCCRTYNFYRGLIVPVKGKTNTKEKESVSAQENREAERARLRAELEDEIASLERTCDACSELSLLGVQVTAPKYGTGTVVSQNASTITVQFSEKKISYILDKKYSARPLFENADTVVDVFTEYNAAAERLKALRRKLSSI